MLKRNSYRPTRAQNALEALRSGQDLPIYQAQQTANDGVARAEGARQRADESFSRVTNPALDSAHLKAQNAKERADESFSRLTNPSLDSAHNKAEAADTRAGNAKQRADESFSRFTNPSLDSAHTKAEAADTRAGSARTAADNARTVADDAQASASRRVPLTGATITGNTYVKAQLSADVYYMNFGGWRKVQRDRQGYLWC